MKYVLAAIFSITLAACVQEGPPNDNMRNQRAQESLRDTDNPPPAGGYYDANGVWHNDYENGTDHVIRHDDN